MRKRTRVHGRAVVSAAAVLLVGLPAAWAQTGGNPQGGAAAKPAPAAGSPQNETAAKPAAAPVFPKRFYRAAGGQFYVPAGVPINLDMSLDQNTANGSNESKVTLKEGPSSMNFGGISMPVIADGTAPKTVLTIVDSTNVESGGLRVLAASPKLQLSASDPLSGVARTLVSIDGAPFVPLPDGGPNVSADGKHQLRYFSVDNVGNAESVKEYAFRIDSTPPKTRLATSGPHSATLAGAGVSLSLSAEDAVAGVDNIFYRVDDAAEQAYEKPLILDNLSEGSHHIEYYSVDRVGNKERAQTFTFVLDRQPPQIVVTIHGPELTSKGVRYVSPSAEIELAGRDTVTGATPIYYRIDDAQQGTLYTAPFHLPHSAGIHHLLMESKDPVQNRVEVRVDDIFVDPTPPATEFQFSRPFFARNGVVVLNPASQIELKASDFESGVASLSYSLDGGPDQKYSHPFSAALGDHTLTVFAVDQVGNREQPEQQRLHVQPPGIGETVPDVLDFKRFYQSAKFGLMAPPGLPIVVRISTSPDPNAQSYMLSMGPTPPPEEQPVTFSSPGKNTVVAGFPKKAEEFAVNVDSASPKTELSATGAHRAEAGGITYFGPGLKISLTSQDDSAGVVSGLWKTLYSIDGSDFATYSAPLAAFLREGAYTLRYFALDNVGNAEAVHELKFTVDSNAPETQMELSGAHFASTVAPVTHIALAATDNLSGVAAIHYQIDNGAMLIYHDAFAVGPLSPGSHRLNYFSVDVAGNSEKEHIWPFTVARPVSAATYEIRGRSVEHGATVFLAPGSALALKAAEGESVVYTLDGGSPKQYSTPIPAPETGSHLVSFHAEDELGLPGATRTLNLVVDRNGPSSSVRFEGPQLTQGTTPLISGATRIVLQANAGAVGGASLEYSLGGNHWQPYTGPFSIKGSGSFDLAYRAHNPVSTQEAVERQRIIVDAQGPVIDLSYSKPVDANSNAVQLQPGTLILISADDVPAGMEKITYQLDSQPALIYRVPLSGFTPGKVHTISIVAEDLLGNRTEKLVRVMVKEQP